MVVVEADDTIDVVVTNTRQVGELVVTKVIEGEVAGATSTFPIVVDCDVDDYDTTFDLTVPPGDTEVSSDPALVIPVGVTCTVTESPVPDGWGLARVARRRGGHHRGGHQRGHRHQQPSRRLPADQQGASGCGGGTSPVFTVEVECDNGFSAQVALDTAGDGADSELVGPIPSGVPCTVTEPATPAGWSLVDVAPETVVIGSDPDTPVTVTVTNERTLGSVQIEKVLNGPAAGAETSFTVDLDCDGDQFDQQIVLTVPDGASNVIETVAGLPTLIECSVTEDVASDKWVLAGIEPESFSVDDDQAVDVTVTNTRERGQITVVKRLSGPVAGADTEFTLALDCDENQFDDDEIVLDVTDGESASTVIDGIPTGTICSLTEPEASEGWQLATILPSQVVVGDEPITLVAVNRRLTGGLEIFKYLLGPVDGAPTTFSAFLNCDGTAFDQDVVIEVRNGVSSRTVIRGIPTGVTCAAEEVNVPPEWSLGGVASNTVTITDTELITVHVVNTRVTGELTVVKAVRGAPSDAAASFDLVMDCDDDLFDTAVPVDLPAGDTEISESYSGIPTGVICSVSEEAVPTGWELVSITPTQAEVREADPAVVTVLNRLSPDVGPAGEGPGGEPPSAGPAGEDIGGELPDTGSQLSLMELLLLLAFAALALTSGTWMIKRARDKP